MIANGFSLAKPSRPSRAYLHLTSSDHLVTLADHVRQTTFEDAQNTHTSSALIGPPTVEFAPYARAPGGRQKTDLRAGTIDQDSDFMAFLEGLANPDAVKDGNTDGLDNRRKTPVTTTPLVQYLKDKKASKTKDAATKAMKKQEIKGKGKDVSPIPDDAKKKGKDVKADKLVEKAAKEAVKILNREAANKTSSSASSPAQTSQASTGEQVPKLDVNKVPSAQRGAAIAAHVRMLKRDLGLGTAQAHRQIRRDTIEASKGEAAEKPSAGKSPAIEEKALASKPSNPATPTAPKAALQQRDRRVRGKGSSSESTVSSATATNAQPSSTSTAAAPPVTPKPMVLLKKPESQQTSSTPPAAVTSIPVPASTPPTPQNSTGSTSLNRPLRKPRAPDTPTEGAHQAFIKHANPSQGVTEPLLKEALEKFGAVSMVEIDRRKGFGYVDFAEPEGLKAAMAANPVAVAQGTVQVMQRKGPVTPASAASNTPAKQPFKGPSPSQRGGRGGSMGRRGGRGGGGMRGGNAAASSSAQGASGSEAGKGASSSGAGK